MAATVIRCDDHSDGFRFCVSFVVVLMLCMLIKLHFSGRLLVTTCSSNVGDLFEETCVFVDKVGIEVVQPNFGIFPMVSTVSFFCCCDSAENVAMCYQNNICFRTVAKVLTYPLGAGVETLFIRR